MKILLGINDRPGSDIFGGRFLPHIKHQHDVKILAFYRRSKYIQWIDWALDPVFDVKTGGFFRKNFGLFSPSVSEKLSKFIIDDIIDWDPDIVISDVEFFSANMAAILGKPLIYCSPLFLLKSVSQPIFRSQKTLLSKLPKADRYFVYSFIGLEDGYDLVTPYTETNNTQLCYSSPDPVFDDLVLKSNERLTTGETSFVADIVSSGMVPMITRSSPDIETMLNGLLVERFKIGVDFGSSKSIKWIRDKSEETTTKPLVVEKGKLLHEYLEEILS
jgi:hypothetical protein